jgi:hypothetical protein
MLVSIDLNLQELNGMRSYFDFITQERPEFPLCVPLACLINYKYISPITNSYIYSNMVLLMPRKIFT